MLAGEQASMASDAFSFGYILWELLTWQLPWSGTQPFMVRGIVAVEVPASCQPCLFFRRSTHPGYGRLGNAAGDEAGAAG